MPAEGVVFVRCWFSRGGFPSERVFHVDAPGGGQFGGDGPDGILRREKRDPSAGRDTPRARLEGLVAGSDREGENGTVRGYLPGDEV